MNAGKMRHILDTIAEMFPDAHCELNHSNPFELTIAVLLSAQCTDETVNKVTASLFQKYKTPQDYLNVPLEELENDIRRIGLFRNKAANIRKLCRMLIDRYGGEVPREHDALTELPGVGRKTANVVVSNAFGVPAIAVDTHVERVSKRLAIAKPDDSVLEVEKKLMKLVPRDEWTLTHHRLIFFGRYHCKAQNPACEVCPLLDVCPEGKKRMKAALKPAKAGASKAKAATRKRTVDAEGVRASQAKGETRTREKAAAAASTQAQGGEAP
ncbi:endonuclease III [Cohnella thermotolerans]|uniref:endonuclease III n=1 Tax=Cohnella thermotolerans TaxID=329858 RepID=UPI000423D9E6|nr:endonuclease III [Cohnella thermotolerans]